MAEEFPVDPESRRRRFPVNPTAYSLLPLPSTYAVRCDKFKEGYKYNVVNSSVVIVQSDFLDAGNCINISRCRILFAPSLCRLRGVYVRVLLDCDSVAIQQSP